MVLARRNQNSDACDPMDFVTKLRKRVDLKVVKHLGCQVKAVCPEADTEVSRADPAPATIVRSKEHPEYFRSLVQEGWLPEKTPEGELIIWLEHIPTQHDIMSELCARKPCKLQREEDEEVLQSKARLSSQITRDLVNRLAEPRQLAPQRAESEPLIGRGCFRDPAEQASVIERLTRPRSHLSKVGLAALGTSSSCSILPTKDATAADEQVGEASETDCSQPKNSDAVEEVLGLLSRTSGSAETTRSRSKQQEYIRRLAVPRARPVTPDAVARTAAVKQIKATEQHESCARLALPRQKPSDASAAGDEENESDQRACKAPKYAQSVDGSLRRQMQRADSAPCFHSTPYEVPVVPGMRQSLATHKTSRAAELRCVRTLLQQLDLTNMQASTAHLKTLLQKMLTMLGKVDDDSSEEGIAIIAQVRKLYEELQRRRNDTTQVATSASIAPANENVVVERPPQNADTYGMCSMDSMVNLEPRSNAPNRDSALDYSPAVPVSQGIDSVLEELCQLSNNLLQTSTANTMDSCSVDAGSEGRQTPANACRVASARTFDAGISREQSDGPQAPAGSVCNSSDNRRTSSRPPRPRRTALSHWTPDLLGD